MRACPACVCVCRVCAACVCVCVGVWVCGCVCVCGWVCVFEIFNVNTDMLMHAIVHGVCTNTVTGSKLKVD